MALGIVELGLSYDDFLRFTPFDIAYLYEKHRVKEMVNFTYVRNSFLNAYVNARRDKKAKFIPLFEEIEGSEEKKQKKRKTPEQLRAERDEFFNMIKALEGGC